MKVLNKIKYLSIAFGLSLTVLSGCGGSSGSGNLSVGLTDAPSSLYSAVYVTIASVQVHKNGPGKDDEAGWQTIATPNRTYNLLDLSDGVVEGLGVGPLDSGSYSQIRLVIGTTPDSLPNIQCNSHPFANYVIDADDGEVHELKVPSGEETGLKIICSGQCDIAENQTTELVLDFNADASVVVAGNSGNYNLKPTIKLATTADFTLITGRVTNGPAGPGIANAEVSAQIFDGTAVDAGDQVTVRTSTLTDVNGDYQLFVKPGDYNLVASIDGFSVGAVNFTALPGQTPVQDFALTAVPTGTANGVVTITGVDADTFAHLSFRQQITLDALPESVELDSLNTLTGAGYSTVLNAGDYEEVASTCGFPSQTAMTTVPAGGTATVNFTF